MVLKQDASISHHERIDPWNIQVNSELCHDTEAGLDHEWLVTNGLGGYASGSLVGAVTRSYHGLLVASLHPPVERSVLVAKVDEVAHLPSGERLALGVNEYAGGIIEPAGNSYLDSVVLDGDIPCFFYRLSETLMLEKRIWMEYGQNITYIQYMLHGAFDEERELSGVEIAGEYTWHSLILEVSPFCLSRDYHSVTTGADDWHFLVECQEQRCRIRAYDGAPAYHLIADPNTSFTPTGLWYWHFWHRRDHERGVAEQEDMYQPGIFRLELVPGIRKTLVLAAETETVCASGYGSARHENVVAHALMSHQRRVQQLLAVADRTTNDLPACDPIQARLTLAADQFIVVRPDYSVSSTVSSPLRLAPDRKTIIAGYPWFTDWGRDSMIALPGLLLCTGRYSEARGLLKAFASVVHHGLIPNRFPDQGVEDLAYNTADATLWMFRTLDYYVLKTGDWTLVKELFLTLSEIIQWHIAGTDYGIKMDPGDGLLQAGAPGVQLTWMDAKVGDWVVTPRRGKPVEVNALWYYALAAMETWAVRLSTDAVLYGQLRAQVRQNFAARYWFAEGGYLYDVVDVEGVTGQNDTSLRPNQLFAASLTHELLSEAQVASMLKQVTDHLLTPVGLRSLSPSDPAYQAHFAGDRLQRDAAYHQGTVWQWLVGPYVDVHLQVHNDPQVLLPLLQPFVEQLWATCLGTIGEIAEPETPFTLRGCFAQAWSVAEVLRCWLVVRNSTH
ncbi:amylo-alpha-1,6-glucosidase [Dictyobacter arantiisoli]|uniref:Glycogen debranching protein n=1 Tax=Dictyobacter arantiisoli TaxID=2014874 RepID=A0A5A5TB64_9CHLR|nr:amylo-alpha-1,6-glucosidase [Dictyobacter arantiisoli]GCF08597.1 glycogen debranching protein [Dictyobacter arantiisoli]